jgi:F-type H+-transporting ATPase subunit b
MDRREQNIRNRLQEAEYERQEAEQEAEPYRKKNEEMDKKGRKMLDQAKEGAEKERESLTQKVREEVEKVRSRWHESVQKEKNAFIRELRQLTASQVYAVSRRALQDLAYTEVEERLVEVFLSELKNMPEEKKHDMVEAIQKGDNNTASVRSGFEIPTKLRRKITEAVHDSLAENAEVTYETIPDMIMGIELKSHGEKMSWSLENYLAVLEERAKETLEKEAQRGAKEEEKEVQEKSQDGQEKEKG